MSLLNQMLNDLEQRRAAGAVPQLHREIRPLPADRDRRLVAGAGIAVLAVTVLAVIGYALWDRFSSPPILPLEVSPPAALSDVSFPTGSSPLRSPEPETKPVTPAVTLRSPSEDAAVPARVGLSSGLRLSEQLTLPQAQPINVPPHTPSQASEAEAAIEKRDVEVSPGERAERLYRSAINQLSQGRDQDGIATLRAALRDDPSHFAARQTLIKHLVDRGAFREAESELVAGLQKSPGQTGWVLLLARLNIDRGDFGAAITVLTQHEGDGGRSADYQGTMAAVFQRLNRHDEAERRFIRATQIDPANGRWWIGLGMAREAMGKQAEARQAYGTALAGRALTEDLRVFAEGRLR